MLSTPILTLVYDLKTAILLTLLPSLVIIIVSLLNCSDVKKWLLEFRLIIGTTTAGSFLGSCVLVWADPDILKIVLACTILIVLFSSKIKLFSTFLNKYPIFFALIMGGLAGVVGGATNAIAPILMIYLLEVTKSAKQVIVVSNICFLLGKLMQATVLSSQYSMGEVLNPEVLLVFTIAIIGLFVGIKLQSKIDEKSYHVLIKNILVLFMIALVYQGSGDFFI
ncbi:sulfite exporter TauE/SafE family protein [Shewanella sp. VB17]|nr:sulfite exporter TauE/SafE family protein [Shewanella sp. VB17]